MRTMYFYFYTAMLFLSSFKLYATNNDVIENRIKLEDIVLDTHEKSTKTPQDRMFHLYDCPSAAANLRQCRPVNIIEYKRGQTFTLGLKINTANGKPLPNAKVTLAVVGRNGEIVNNAIMLWGKRTVTVHTDNKGQVLFRQLFFPTTYRIGAKLSVLAEVADSKHLAKFPLVRNAPVKLIGKPHYRVQESYPMTAVWSLTYDDMLLAYTEVSWYAVASNGVTATRKLKLIAQPTNSVTIRASSANINKSIFSGECHTLVVKIMPPGAGKETITASRIGC